MKAGLVGTAASGLARISLILALVAPGCRGGAGSLASDSGTTGSGGAGGGTAGSGGKAGAGGGTAGSGGGTAGSGGGKAGSGGGTAGDGGTARDGGKAGSGGGTAGDGGTARDGASGDAPVVGTNCGAAGQVCCAGNTCKSGGCCVAGMCKANGASCMPANGTCKDGLCGACSGLRVFSWNIAHLGNNGRTAEQLGNLAKRMAGLKPAVMGLQEQEDLRTTRNVVAAMGAQYAVNSDCDETCLVWDTTKVSGIHFKYWSEPLGGMEHSSFRAPLAGVFQPVGGSVADRFIVLSLHAHWNSNDERCAQGRYLRALMQHFLADPESPHDVVFLGDYNNSPSDCPHTTLQPSGAEPIAALLPKSNGDGTYGSRGSPLDHMWVSKSMLTRLVTPDTFVFRPDFFGESYSTFSATCSDHFPIMSQVCQMAGTQTQGTGSTTSTDWVPQKTVCANETGQQGDFGLS